MFFDRWRKQKKERRQGEEDFQKYASTQEAFYGGGQKVMESPGDRTTDRMNVRRLVVSNCEQMLDISREIEDARVEYEQVTEEISDIQRLEELPEMGKNKILETANNLINLRKNKDEFYKTDRKITDAQYTIIQQAEDEIDTVMKRFETNETYLDTINRDLHYLEGEKMEWDIVRQECIREQNFLRHASIFLLVAFVVALGTIFAVGEYFQLNVQLEFMVALFVSTLLGVIILVKFQDDTKEIRRCEVNRNYAITLENKVKLKYVNTKNAVDYTCAKYHVSNSKELAYIYEAYKAFLKEQERLRQMNEDMTYYENQLLLMLENYKVEDAESWVSNPAALVDEKQMTQIRKGLMLRRKKLRDRIQYNLDAIKQLRQGVEANMGGLDEEDREQIRDVVERIQKVNQNLV